MTTKKERIIDAIKTLSDEGRRISLYNVAKIVEEKRASDEGRVGRYFRKLAAIETTIYDLHKGSGLSKDVRAIKAMKRVENIMKDFDEQKPQDTSIDEGCVGCAGPCKVVDVAANLQEELDECVEINSELVDRNRRITIEITSLRDTVKNFKTIETRETDRLHKIIDELKDQNSNDLNELYELDKEDIEDLRSQLTDCKKIDCHNSGVFKNIINGLEAEKDVLNDRIIEKALKSQKLDVVVSDLMRENVAIEAELSARKEDKTTVFEIEYPVDRSRTIHLQKMRIDEQKKTIEELKVDFTDANDKLNKIHTLVNTLFDNKVADYATILGNIRGLSDTTEPPIDEDQDIEIVFTYSEIL